MISNSGRLEVLLNTDRYNYGTSFPVRAILVITLPSKANTRFAPTTEPVAYLWRVGT